VTDRRIRELNLPTVAVVGRPNVGKSTLVNRLVGGRQAIVEAKPGVTRDRTTHVAEWRGRRIAIVDTGGWTPGWARNEESYDDAVSAQAERATTTADLIVFVVDVTVGVTEEDAAAAGWLRGGSAPVLLVANKVDTRGLEPELAELYRLGLGDPIAVSAQHGRGSGDLLDDIIDALGAAGAFERPADDPDDDTPSVALIGRPNVGKSSLFNRLLGEERTIVDDRPGTTRDAVDTVIELPDGRAYRFVDTAGLRRKFRHGEPTEYYSTVRTVQALETAAVAVLVIDAAEEIGEQEQKLARQILDAGRALVLVLNKWDLVDDYRRERVDKERDRLLHFIAWAPLVRTSAASGRGLDKLLPAVDRVLEESNRRIATAQLNEWLADATAATPPPMHAGRNVRIRYITQVGVAPPTFRVFTTAELSPGYLRYLERRLRESFGFAGTPIDIGFRIRTRWEERDSSSASGGKRRKQG
jgi:GTPase